jgi:hypothetical protein
VNEHRLATRCDLGDTASLRRHTSSVAEKRTCRVRPPDHGARDPPGRIRDGSPAPQACINRRAGRSSW